MAAKCTNPKMTRMSIGSRHMGPPGTLFVMPRGHFVTYEDADAEWMIALGIGVSELKSLGFGFMTSARPDNLKGNDE